MLRRLQLLVTFGVGLVIFYVPISVLRFNFANPFVESPMRLYLIPEILLWRKITLEEYEKLQKEKIGHNRGIVI